MQNIFEHFEERLFSDNSSVGFQDIRDGGLVGECKKQTLLSELNMKIFSKEYRNKCTAFNARIPCLDEQVFNLLVNNILNMTVMQQA